MTDDNLSSPAPKRNPVVQAEDGKIFASSRDVAEFFEKQHGHVLRDIDALIREAPEAQSNFGEGFYTLPSTGSQQHRCFNMTRDGFTLLAMGFTGAKALQWKLRYLEAFNAMETELLKARPALSQFDMMRAVIDNLEANNQRLFAVEKAVENFGAHEDYRTVKAHAAIIGVKLKGTQSADLGRIATSLSRQRKVSIGKQPDATYGQVNVYHRDILDEVFKEMRGSS